MSELESSYSLEECTNTKEIKRILNGLKKTGKIDFVIQSNILDIDDLDLTENDISELIEIFDKYDVFVYDKEDYELDSDEYYDSDEFDSDY